MPTRMTTRKFWADTAERVVRTAAQAAIAAIGTTAVVQEVDWAVVGGTTLTASILAFLTALAAKGAGDPGSASFQEDVSI